MNAICWPSSNLLIPFTIRKQYHTILAWDQMRTERDSTFPKCLSASGSLPPILAPPILKWHPPIAPSANKVNVSLSLWSKRICTVIFQLTQWAELRVAWFSYPTSLSSISISYFYIQSISYFSVTLRVLLQLELGAQRTSIKSYFRSTSVHDGCPKATSKENGVDLGCNWCHCSHLRYSYCSHCTFREQV